MLEFEYEYKLLNIYYLLKTKTKNCIKLLKYTTD